MWMAALAAAACAFIDVKWPEAEITLRGLHDMDGTVEMWFDATNQELHVRYRDDMADRVWRRVTLS